MACVCGSTRCPHPELVGPGPWCSHCGSTVPTGDDGLHDHFRDAHPNLHKIVNWDARTA